MKCPKCESENTQRLEVAFQGGTQNISTSSNSTGIGIGSGGSIGLGFGKTKTSGQSQSVLAQQAAPPAKKSQKWPIIGIALGALMVYSKGPAELIIIGFIAGGVGAYFYYSRKQYNTKEWPSLYQHWSESWLCHKCGGIYHQALA